MDNYHITGNVTNLSDEINGYIPLGDMIDIEALWDKMYTKALGVIVFCAYCNTPQVISNCNCSQCGGALPKPKPLGSGI